MKTKRKTKFIEVIGYNNVVKDSKDIWVPPEIWKNSYGIPYHIGCFPKCSHVINNSSINVYIDHNMNGTCIGNVERMKLINKFTRDSNSFMSILCSLNIYEDLYHHVLNKFNVTSFHDLYWSLSYKLEWKDHPEFKNNKMKAINNVTPIELSVTRNPRFRDCITLIEGNDDDIKVNNIFYTTWFKLPQKQENLNTNVISNYMKLDDNYDKEINLFNKNSWIF